MAALVDNIEDVDALVGWLAEFVRPHGFAISETQFQVFILNASRRLFSDRFLTSSFRPEFYTHFGVKWVNENGPEGKRMEKDKPNGHDMEVSPLKRVLLADDPGAESGARPSDQYFRSLGAGSRRVLFVTMETASRRGDRRRFQRKLSSQKCCGIECRRLQLRIALAITSRPRV